MVDAFDITEPSNPLVLFVPAGDASVRRQLAALEAKGGQVRHFHARDLTTPRDIYRAFAETLLFHGYFGWNWDAMVDCLGDLCGAVTGSGVGVAGVIREADALLPADHFPLFVSVLCQGADRAEESEHFVFEFREFDRDEIVRRVAQPDLTVTVGEHFVGAALNPEEW